MDKIIKDVLEWILIEAADAPKAIRKKALLGLTGPTAIGNVLLGGHEVSEETYNMCEESMFNGKKIQAIKDLRQMSSLSLKEAKDAIEEEFINRVKEAKALEARGF